MFVTDFWVRWNPKITFLGLVELIIMFLGLTECRIHGLRFNSTQNYDSSNLTLTTSPICFVMNHIDLVHHVQMRTRAILMFIYIVTRVVSVVLSYWSINNRPRFPLNLFRHMRLQNENILRDSYMLIIHLIKSN